MYFFTETKRGFVVFWVVALLGLWLDSGVWSSEGEFRLFLL